MESAKIPTHRYFYPVVILAIWTGFGILFGTQNYIRDAYAGSTPHLGGYIISWIICGYSWAILTSPAVRLARRVLLVRRNIPYFLLIHIVAGSVFSFVQLAIYVGIVSLLLFDNGKNLVEYYKYLVANEFLSSLLIYFTVIFAVNIFDYFRASHGNNLDKSFELVQTDHPDTNGVNWNRAAAEGAIRRRFSVKENGRIVLIDPQSVDWITSDGNYINLNTNTKKYMIRETMKSIEQKLDRAEFVRIRRSTIVRIQAIKEFRPLFNGEFDVLLKNGIVLASSRRYRSNLDPLIKN